MVNDNEDMTKPVTKAELDHKLDLLIGAIGARFDALAAQLTNQFTNLLSLAVARLNARLDKQAQLLADLPLELARHVCAVQENLSSQVVVLDDKYKGLPPRVTRLERKVFPKRR